MIISAIKTSIQEVLSKIVSPEIVIFVRPNAPRPDLPYWTISLNSVVDVGMKRLPSIHMDNDGKYQLLKTKEATITIERYGDGSFDKVGQLVDIMILPSIKSQIEAKKIVIFDNQAVQDLSSLMDNNYFEERGSVDFMIRFGIVLEDQGNWVEKVVVTEKVD